MKRFWAFAGAGAFGLILAVSLSVVFSGPSEPQYEGRKLGLWLDDLNRSSSSIQINAATNAIHHLGTNAVPYLIDLLRPRDNALKGKVIGLLGRQHFIRIRIRTDNDRKDLAARAIWVLGPEAKATAPALTKVLIRDGFSATPVDQALVRIGPEAVPALKAGLTSTNYFSRIRAATALSIISSNTEEVLAPMFAELANGNDLTRSQAAYILTRYPQKAELIVPVLMTYLNDRDQAFRYNIRLALVRFGPAARPAIPVILQRFEVADVPEVLDCVHAIMALAPEEALHALIKNLECSDAIPRQNSAYGLREFKERGQPAVPSLVRCLKDKEGKVRQYAALALGDIGLEPDLVVPPLLENLRDPDLDIRICAALALGAFGERAKAAVPEVRKLVNETKASQLSHESMVNVLSRIDPNSSEQP